MNQMHILNKEAMLALENRDCRKAQALFFENVKKYPCHETYNNLGYFLITEGLECKNGQVRNASLLGWKYLHKSAHAKESSLNLVAIVSAIDRDRSIISRKYRLQCTNQYAYELLDRAHKMNDDVILQYNRLRFLYLCDPQSIVLRDEIEHLVLLFEAKESVILYLSVLCERAEYDLCISKICQYDCYLDEDDKLVLYYFCGRFDEGAQLYQTICSKYALGKEESAMLIECLIHEGRFHDAKAFADLITEREKEMSGNKILEKQWKNIFADINKSTLYRKSLISSYHILPPFIEQCCYYGCPKHHTTYLYSNDVEP